MIKELTTWAEQVEIEYNQLMNHSIWLWKQKQILKTTIKLTLDNRIQPSLCIYQPIYEA